MKSICLNVLSCACIKHCFSVWRKYLDLALKYKYKRNNIKILHNQNIYCDFTLALLCFAFMFLFHYI